MLISNSADALGGSVAADGSRCLFPESWLVAQSVKNIRTATRLEMFTDVENNSEKLHWGAVSLWLH